MSKKGLWRLLETMGLKFGSHWVPCSYLGGALDQFFFEKIDYFVFVKWGPSHKMVSQIRRVFGFGGGLPWGPLRPPPPPLGES